MENPISYLLHDLDFALKLCNEQIKQKEYRRYIISSNRTFLDDRKLQSYLIDCNPTDYLTTNLKSILIKTLKVINLDFQLEEIEKITIEKDLHYTVDFGEDYGFMSDCFPIKCYTLDDFKILKTNLTTQQNRDLFIKRSVSADLISFDIKKEFENYYKHNTYNSNDFAKKCSHIVQIVTGFFGLRTEDEMNEFLKSKETTQSEPKTQNNQHKDIFSKYWFIVGLKLATGELLNLFKENNQNATQTAIKLGNKNLRPYISESIANTNSTDKNIFKRKQSDIDLILNYCKENNMVVCNDFTNKTQNQSD